MAERRNCKGGGEARLLLLLEQRHDHCYMMDAGLVARKPGILVGQEVKWSDTATGGVTRLLVEVEPRPRGETAKY